VPGEYATTADWVASAVARTVAAGTARVFCALSADSPVPEPGDRSSEGVADFAARRARVWQAVLFTERMTPDHIRSHEDDEGISQLRERTRRCRPA